MTVAVHRAVPITLELPAWRYAEMYAGDPWRFLLDSALPSHPHARHTFVGGEPFLVHQTHRIPGAGPGQAATIRQWRPEDGWRQWQAEPLDALRQALQRYEVPADEGASPFRAGAVGWLGYEAGHFVEALPDRGTDDLGLPDSCWMFVDVVLVADVAGDRAWVSAVGRGPDRATAEASARALAGRLEARVRAFEATAPSAWLGPRDGDPPREVAVRSHFDGAGYRRVVEAARAHIFAGDVFEVCTTHRLDAPYAHAPWALYAELRRINPAPFACFIETPEVAIVSASPERFLRLGPGRVVESRPIKGTRPRGRDLAEDAELAAELAASPKDRAENVMIVDLVRNDIGRVAQIGSVEVPELMVVESYATVHQLVSTVRGRLRADRDAIDLIAACFPGGSMTGAPKVEAMKIIDALEPVKRGVYAGAIGYLDFGGTLDLNIVIRTVVVKDGRAYFGVGGAVVADSLPEAEYRETLDKAQALVRAIENVERVLGR